MCSSNFLRAEGTPESSPRQDLKKPRMAQVQPRSRRGISFTASPPHACPCVHLVVVTDARQNGTEDHDRSRGALERQGDERRRDHAVVAADPAGERRPDRAQPDQVRELPQSVGQAARDVLEMNRIGSADGSPASWPRSAASRRRRARWSGRCRTLSFMRENHASRRVVA